MGTPGWYPRRYLTEHERATILQQAVVQYTGSTGGRVIAQSPTSAAVIVGAEANHIVHVLLTIFTCGLWLPFWLLFAMLQREKRYTIVVDEVGGLHWLDQLGRPLPPTIRR